MKRTLLLGCAAGLVTVGLAACGSRTNKPSTGTSQPASAPASAEPASVPPSAGIHLSGGGFTGGLGNTKADPDSNSVCDFAGLADPKSTVVIAYVTVAGSDTSAPTLCNAFDDSNYYTPGVVIPPDSPPGCWLTTADGRATARIYTAPQGSTATTTEICHALLQGAGISKG